MLRCWVILSGLVFCFAGDNIAYSCDITPDEVHKVKMNAEPPLYFDDNCLTQLFDKDTNNTQHPAIKLKNDCPDTISFSPSRCDGSCLPFKLKPNEEVTLKYPGISGLRDGQRNQYIYAWSTSSQQGVISLTSTYVEAAAYQPCSSDHDNGCAIQRTVPTKRSSVVWLAMCLLWGCLIRESRRHC